MSHENASSFPEISSLSPDELELEYGSELDIDLSQFPPTDEVLPKNEKAVAAEETIDPSLLEKIRKQHGEYHFGAFAVATTLAIGLPYPYDVEMNRLKETYAEPRIKVIAKAPEGVPNSGSNTYFLNGIDTSNSNIMTERLAPAIQLISPDPMKSVDFANSELKINSLARKIMEDAERDGKVVISIVGNSTGGIIALLVAKEIIEKSDIRVETIYLYETPNGVDGLQAGSKRDLAMLMELLAPIPGSENSSFVRDWLTVASEKPRYTHGNNVIEDIMNFDFGDFNKTFWEATEKTRSEQRPRMKTLYKQGLIVADADLESTINDIGKMKNEEYMPTVVNIMSDPQNATVVNTLKSTKETKEYLYKAGINTFSVVVDSDTQRHTSFDFDTEANVEALTPWVDEILASHSENDTKIALINSEYFQKDTIKNND